MKELEPYYDKAESKMGVTGTNGLPRQPETNAFKVVNSRNEFVGTIGNTLYLLTEPALRPIRRFIPDLGGIDISPILAWFLLGLVQSAFLTIL